MFHICISIFLEKYTTIYICRTENEMTLKLSVNKFYGNLDIKFSGHIFMGITSCYPPSLFIILCYQNSKLTHSVL